MLLSEKQTLAILRRFSVPVSPSMCITKNSDIHATLANIDLGKNYFVSSAGGSFVCQANALEAALGKALSWAEEVVVGEHVEGAYTCSLTIFIAGDCRVFLRLTSAKKQAQEEIVGMRLWDFQIHKSLLAIGLPWAASEHFIKMVHKAFEAFLVNDAVRLTIDPLIVQTSNIPVAETAVMEVDDASVQWHRELLGSTDASQSLPALLPQGMGNLVCIANGRALVLSCVDYFATHGVRSSLAIDVGAQMDETILERGMQNALKQHPKDKVFIYFFTGLTSAALLAKVISSRFPKTGNIGVLFEGTNAAGAMESLKDRSSLYQVFTTFLEALDWAKKGR